MRNIKEFAGTTPVYVYNISDADIARVELNKMAIGMSISLGENVYYVLPVDTPPEIFDFTGVPAENIWRNNNYCKHIANSNQFILTVPLWRIPLSETETSGTYQIFLFMEEDYSISETIYEDGEIVGIRPTVVNPINMVIDYGGFALLDRLAPKLIGQSKRYDNNLVFI
jgi:hypothetical protein